MVRYVDMSLMSEPLVLEAVELERAAEVVANTNNLGAAYHLAKQYEAKDVRAHHHQMEQPALRVGLKRPTA